NFTNFATNFSLLTVSCTLASTAVERESREIKNFSLLPSILKLMTLSSGTTMGRTFKLCGLTGVMTKFLEAGEINGPPQLNEYPVDPVGVDTISPSAQ